MTESFGSSLRYGLSCWVLSFFFGIFFQASGLVAGEYVTLTIIVMSTIIVLLAIIGMIKGIKLIKSNTFSAKTTIGIVVCIPPFIFASYFLYAFNT